MCIYFIEQACVIYVVYFEPRALFLQHEYVFEFFKVVKALYSNLVLLLVNDSLRREVVLDDVLKGSIVPEQSKLNNVAAELFPLHGLIAVDINLLEEIDKCQC